MFSLFLFCFLRLAGLTGGVFSICRKASSKLSGCSETGISSVRFGLDIQMRTPIVSVDWLGDAETPASPGVSASC